MQQLDTTGSSFNGIYIHTSLQRLIDVFGNETRLGSGDGKVTHEWVIDTGLNEDSVQTFITIYDYKDPPLDEVSHLQWHVGGRLLPQDRIVAALLKSGLFLSEIEIVKCNRCSWN